MRLSTRITSIAATVAVVLLLASQAANAAYYNTYADVASTPDVSGATSTQGFAAGSTYLYSVKTRSAQDDDRAVIYRVNKDTGATEVMTNGTDGLGYNTWLGHANDMTIVDIDGDHHLFVVTMAATGAQLVKLRYDGATYYKVGSYAIELNGAVKAVSGIAKSSVTSTAINFLFKSGTQIYTASLPLRANSGTIALTKAFSLDIANAQVNGATVSNIGDYLTQGMFYDAAHDTLYFPLTLENRSIVLVYPGVTPSSTGTVSAASDLSFRITSSKYTLFEIEGVGVSNGTLWFNTNRANADGGFDAVHSFDGYTVS
ncbi:hypothetical protein [Nocardioides sp.]|uniref:hypothetical protein n=1 Tax=Nocardioides sp. TaxID=35761 RepID=UPI00260F2960|nr:hypothetical protein [Nocardioides sp.]